MDSMTSWRHHGIQSQSSKSSQMKDEGGNAALIPGSSAWGALKGGTSQKPLILSSDGAALSGEKTSPKPSLSGEKSWPPTSSAMHINGIVSRWSSSSSGANGSWADSKDVGTGWGSPDTSPIPNAGTEVWSAQKQSAEGGAASRWVSSCTAGSVWGGGDAKNNVETDTKSVWALSTCTQPSVWGVGGDGRSVSILSSPGSNSWPPREQTSSWPQSTSVLTQSSSLSSTWAQAASQGLPAVTGVSKAGNCAPGSNMSRDELIVRAINSQDGWGQTPIRQDTAWDVTAEQPVTSVMCKMPPAQAEPTVQQGSNTGTAIWESAKDSPPVLTSDLSPHVLLATSGRESLVGKLPWMGSETGIGTGWEIPSQIEGSALLSGERSASSVKPGTYGSMASAAFLPDGKDAGAVGSVNPWNSSDKVCEPTLSMGGPQTDGGGVSQCSALAVLLNKYERSCQSAAAAAAVWDNPSHRQSTDHSSTTVNPSPVWGGPAVDQRNDIWNQTGGVPKPAQWGSGEPSDTAVWSSTALGKAVEQGTSGGWSDASWPGITTDLKPPSAAAWNAPPDLGQTTMMTGGKKASDAVVTEHLQGEAVSPPSASALYLSDSSAADMQKYRQLYVAAGSAPSSAVNLVPSASVATAATSPPVMKPPPTGIITPNIHQPPPALPPFPPPLQQSKPAMPPPSISPQQAQQLIQAQMLQQIQSAVQAGGQLPALPTSLPPSPSLVIQLHHLVQLQQILQRLQLQQASAYAAHQQARLPRLPTVRPDALTVKIAKVRQQIVALHLQIKHQQVMNAAANAAGGTSNPPQDTSTFDAASHDLARDFSGAMMMRDDIVSGWKSTLADLSHSTTESADSWPGWPASVLNPAALETRPAGMEGSDASARDASAASLDIEEFIPGKLWQGPSIRSADDDPYITPGGTASAVTNDDRRGSLKTSQDMLAATQQSSTSNNVWPVGTAAAHGDSAGHNFLSVTARVPPGLVPSSSHWLQQQPAFTRSTSWTPQSSSYGTRSTCSIVVKNLPVQVDGSVVRGVCQQHGTVQYFHHHLSSRQAIVTYATPDEAAAAQRSLNAYSFAGATLSADFIPDADVTQLSSSAPTSDLMAASLSSIWAAVPVSESSQPGSVWHSAGGVWGTSAGGGGL